MMHTLYKNVLSNEYFTELSDRLAKSKSWEFSNSSGSIPFERDDSYHFWYNDLTQDFDFTNTVFEKICNLTNKNFKLHTVNANGQTYGQPGHLHIDMDIPEAYTFLLYMNNYWNVEWGGSTVIYDHVNNDVEQVLPIPNTGILFKGNLLHYGSEPTRHFKGLRMTVAYKLIELGN
jgi:hypothetical protein